MYPDHIHPFPLPTSCRTPSPHQAHFPFNFMSVEKNTFFSQYIQLKAHIHIHWGMDNLPISHKKSDPPLPPATNCHQLLS